MLIYSNHDDFDVKEGSTFVFDDGSFIMNGKTKDGYELIMKISGNSIVWMEFTWDEMERGNIFFASTTDIYYSAYNKEESFHWLA